MASDRPSPAGPPGQPGATPPRSVGLVLGAGGIGGWAWLVGCLAALEEAAGWDARTADLVVGTSAGAGVAATLRGGVSAADQFARYQPTRHGESPTSGAPVRLGRVAAAERPGIGAHATRAAAEAPAEPDVAARLADTSGPCRQWPQAPQLALLSLRWPPRPGLALAGLLPRGRHSLDDLTARLRALHPTGWPREPLWIAATRADTGRRVVFGRDGVDGGDVATAVRASAAVPGWYEPVRIDGRTYLDGGAWSATNADVVAGLGLDVALVLAPLSLSTSRIGWRGERLRRAYHRSVLSREVDVVHGNGTDVVVIEPHLDDLVLLDGEARRVDGARRLAIAERARQRVLERLADDPSLAAAVTDVRAAS